MESEAILFYQAAGIVIIGVLATWLLTEALFKKLRSLPLTEEQKRTIVSFKGIVEVILYIIIVLTALSALGVDIVPLLTSLGIVGVAVSLAVKDLLADYVAGLVLIVGRSLRKGQRIKILDKGIEGVVEEIGWRQTTLLDGEKIITIPNRVVAASTIMYLKE